MTTRGRACSICSNPDARKLVNVALAGGSTVAEVIREYSAAQGFSEAAAYRHAQHAARFPLTAEEEDDAVTKADVGSRLLALATTQGVDYDLARRNGNLGAATRVGRELRQTLSKLAETFGDDPEQAVKDAAEFETLRYAIGRAMSRRPDWGRELAEAFTDSGNKALFNTLADRADANRK